MSKSDAGNDVDLTRLQQLTFLTEDEVAAVLHAELRNAAEEFIQNHSWCRGRPEIATAEETDDAFGGSLALSNRWHSQNAPHDVDVAEFKDTQALIEFLCLISEANHLSFDLNIENTYVGSIIDGQPNKVLAIGLIEEWRKKIGA